MKTKKFVHYYASKKQKFIIVSQDARPVGEKITVSGKREARKIVQKLNAEAWNFQEELCHQEHL